MKLVKDLHYFDKPSKVDPETGESMKGMDFKLVVEERNLLCMSCMCVFKGEMYLMILPDETKAIAHVFAPTLEKPFHCKECTEKIERENDEEKNKKVI